MALLQPRSEQCLPGRAQHCTCLLNRSQVGNLGLYDDPWKGIFSYRAWETLEEKENPPLGVPVLYGMAVPPQGAREPGGWEPRPNLLHTVCGPSWYLYTDAARRQAAREQGRRRAGPRQPAPVCVEGGGCSMSISVFPLVFFFF